MGLQVKIDPRITEVVNRLQSAGFESYIVGGAVRDFLLDRTPKDYDITTAATPEQVRSVFRDRRTIVIGRRFRLVHLYLGEDIIEISTFRKCPSLRAQMDRPPRAVNAPDGMIFNDNEFGTAEEDAGRRDFTVNALFYDPVHDRLIDHTGKGEEDIRSGTVRIIGDPFLRLEEDPVRILRALKLVGQYGFHLESETEKALQKAMPLIVHASPSRMTLELEKILKNPYGDSILRTFHRYGFLKYFLPFVEEHFDLPACQYAMELFARRNERLRAGLYRDSMSLVIALFTLPFMESKRGTLWIPHDGIETQLNTMMHRIFHPMTLTRRSCGAALRSLMSQVRLRSVTNEAGVHPSPVYPTARELALIQNDVEWHINGLEEILPPSIKLNTRRKRNRRRHRRNGNPPANTQQQAPAGC